MTYSRSAAWGAQQGRGLYTGAEVRANELGLAEGQQVTAVVKASDVILAVAG